MRISQFRKETGTPREQISTTPETHTNIVSSRSHNRERNEVCQNSSKHKVLSTLMNVLGETKKAPSDDENYPYIHCNREERPQNARALTSVDTTMMQIKKHDF